MRTLSETTITSLPAALKIFLEIYHKERVDELRTEDKPAALIIDFYELEGFLRTNTCFDSVDKIRSVISGIEAAINKDLEVGKINAIISSVPYSVMLKDLDSANIGQFISTAAMIKNITPVKTRIKNAVFECKTCLRLYHTEMEGTMLTEPGLCMECGGRSFRLMTNECQFINYRYVKLEEPLELRKYGATREFMAYIEGELASPRQNFKPGDVTDVSGFFDVIHNQKDKEWQFIINANNIKPLNSTFEDIELSKEDIDEITEISQREDVFNLFINSIAPHTHGYEEIKSGIVLQQFEGYHGGEDENDRWIIHILIIGDPGIGKSKTLMEVSSIVPKGIYVSGAGATDVGLTASAVKDELTGKWAMEAGAIVLADSGVLCIDEFDKMRKTTMKTLNEPMEQLTVTTAKAGLVQTMTARTSILAAANPKYSRFDRYKSIKEQIDIPESTLSRFDLVYAMEDKILADEDKDLAGKILDHEQAMEELERLDGEVLKKYVAYAKREIHPKLMDEAKTLIVDFYVKTRQAASENPDSKPITPRDLEAIERLSVARAKVELREYVTLDDAKCAIDIFRNALKTVGLVPETAGSIRGVKSNKEMRQLEKAEVLIKKYFDLYGFNLPKGAVDEVKDEIKVHCGVDGDLVDEIYQEVFSNIKEGDGYY